MRSTDGELLEPEIAEALQAIDATLAGEPVEPRFAEVAELSLLLAAERPATPIEFRRSLDERLQARFVAPDRGLAARAWSRRPMLGTGALAGAIATAAAVAIVVTSGGGKQLVHPATLPASRAATAPGAAGATSSAASSAARAPSSAASSAPRSAASSAVAGRTPGVGAVTPNSLRPPLNGRKIIQSATIDLATDPTRIDDVAQQVLNVVGSVSGIVDNSSVTSTGGPDGNAQFALRIPSPSLAQAMTELSRLRFANVVSRTDSTEDVNARFVDVNRQLADASALRSSLLKRLAAATSQTQTDSLKGQISVVEATIASERASLRALNSQVDYSHVALTIEAAVPPPAPGGGFGLQSAAHDALRVLTVAAGVALIALAVLIPVGLLGALGWWSFASVRRRRREQALDLA